jgi:hypothetical protein
MDGMQLLYVLVLMFPLSVLAVHAVHRLLLKLSGVH